MLFCQYQIKFAWLEIHLRVRMEGRGPFSCSYLAQFELLWKKKKYVKRKKERKQGAGLSFIKPHKGMVKTLKQNRIFLNFSSNVYTLKSEIEEDNYKKKNIDFICRNCEWMQFFHHYSG